MPSTDRKLELKAKTSVAQTVSQPFVYAKGLNSATNEPLHQHSNPLMSDRAGDSSFGIVTGPRTGYVGLRRGRGNTFFVSRTSRWALGSIQPPIHGNRVFSLGQDGPSLKFTTHRFYHPHIRLYSVGRKKVYCLITSELNTDPYNTSC
jgi:hypothetical protein